MISEQNLRSAAGFAVGFLAGEFRPLAGEQPGIGKMFNESQIVATGHRLIHTRQQTNRAKLFCERKVLGLRLLASMKPINETFQDLSLLVWRVVLVKTCRRQFIS